MPPAKKMLLGTPKATTPDPSEEKPVLGTMNYARKFRGEPTGGYSAPGMPLNVKKKTVVAKPNSGYLTMYADGVKKMKPGTDKEQADPSVAFGEEPEQSPNYLSEEDADPQAVTPTAPAKKMAIAKTTAAVPASYQDAAKLIKADKGLYAQYKAGVASGKAFSLNVGGKSFAYAATPKATGKAAVTKKAAPTTTPKKMASPMTSPEDQEDVMATGRKMKLR